MSTKKNLGLEVLKTDWRSKIGDKKNLGQDFFHSLKVYKNRPLRG